MPVNGEMARAEIPFLLPDLPQAEEVLPFLRRIDKTKWYSNFGPLQHELESRLAEAFFPELLGASDRIVACSSGTAAIELALEALTLPKNSRVLVPSFTFAATATAIIRAGYTPIFCDVDPESWSLTPEIAYGVLNYLSVDVVVPVAALGAPQDAIGWGEFAIKTGIPVVIDAAAALGEQPSHPSLTVCYSMHATKRFGIGEGGLVVAPDAHHAEEIRRLSNFGFHDSIVMTAGSNYKLSEYHAAVGLAQMARLSLLKKRRERVCQAYESHLHLERGCYSVQKNTQLVFNDNETIISLKKPMFTSTVAVQINHAGVDASLLVDELLARGIGVRRWYAPSLHKHNGFNHLETVDVNGGRSLVVTESLNASLIGLPFHNFLHHDEVAYVCDALDDVVSSIGQVSQVKLGA